MATRRANLPLWLLLLLRRLSGPAGRLAPLTVLSVAVSVMLATSLEMSSRSAQVQLERTAEAMAGAASIEIFAGTAGIPESLLEIVRSVPGVLAASPLITARVRIADRDFALNLVGIDLLAEQQVRRNAITRRGVQIRDPLRLLAQPEAVIVTRSLLERLGLSSAWDAARPAEFRVRVLRGESTLRVEGVLERGGIADAYGGQVAAMDVYSLQNLVGREGWLDRIDVVPAPGQDVDRLIAAVQAPLAGMATVRRSSARTRFLDDVVGMLRLAVLLFTGLGGVVCGLLTYATMTLSVDRERRYLAILRAVGMEAVRVRRSVVLQAAVLSAAGTLLGFAAGAALAEPMLEMLSIFTRQLQAEEVVEVSILPATVAVAVLVGVVAALLGSVGPARLAARRFALDAREEEVLTDPRVGGGWTAVAVGCTALVVAALALPHSLPSLAVARVGVSFAAGLGVVASLAPAYPRVLRLITAPLRRLLPGVGHLVGRSFGARPWSFAVVITSITAVVAALAGMSLLVESLANTLEEWTASRATRGTLITAGSVTNIDQRELISPETLRIIRSTPGVEAVNEQHRFGPTILFRGEEVHVEALTMDVVATHSRLATVGRPSPDVARDVLRGEVAVSTGFSQHFGVVPGDVIELDTPMGRRAFRIAGVIQEYAGATGTILFDIRVFDAHWPRNGAWAAGVWTREPKQEVLEEIRRRTAAVQDLFFVDSADLARINRGWVLQFTAPLYVIGVFVAAFGGLAVTILLLGTVAERRQEFAVLRAAGAEPKHVVVLVVLDALTIALAASVAGLVLGMICALPMTDVLRGAYGWIIQRSFFAPALIVLVGGTCVSALVGAMVPARSAYRTLPSEVFAPE